jgi:bacterioferritin (cytochrome b1)
MQARNGLLPGHPAAGGRLRNYSTDVQRCHFVEVYPEMQKRPLTDPQYWRDRAEEARMHAAEAQDPQMKSLWLRIVEGHERQADILQRALDLLTDKPPER